MRQKEFTKKQVKQEIKIILNYWKFVHPKNPSEKVSLRSVIGDYQNNAMLRSIKEVLFDHIGKADRNGATWYLRYPKKGPKELAKKVMKTTYVTTLNSFPF